MENEIFRVDVANTANATEDQLERLGKIAQKIDEYLKPDVTFVSLFGATCTTNDKVHGYMDNYGDIFIFDKTGADRLVCDHNNNWAEIINQ